MRREPIQIRCPTHTGTPSQLHERVVGAHREQVADVLVGHGAEPGVGIPHRGRPGREPGRVQVEVLLGVGGHQTRFCQQQR